MIDWTSIKATAQQVIEDLSGVDVVWQDEAEGTTWREDPVILLRVSALAETGIGYEIREIEDDEQSVTVVAQKRFTLSLRCESFNDDLASGKHAGDILERVKTRLCRTTTVERLRGIFCVQETLGTNWFNYVSQGRQVSCYVLDLGCATADVDTDDTVDGSYINEVQVKSDKVRDIAGNVTDSQVDIDVTRGA